MQVTTADLWAPRPGQVLRWHVKASGAGTPAPLSLNQRNHLAAVAAGAPSVWLAAAFDVDGPIDPVALRLALTRFVARHSSLQLEALPPDGPGSDAGPQAVRHRPGALFWSMTEGPTTTSVEATQRLLRETLTDGCRPFRYPAYVPLAISRPDRSTVVLAMDHLHCDAYSLTIVIDELATLYDSHRRNVPADLPEAACFVSDVELEVDEPVHVGPHDERLRRWHDELRRHDFTLPTFALPLGVAPGKRVAQGTIVRPLADAALADALSARARATGSSAYAVTLATLAEAVRRCGGPPRLETLAPVHTRADPAARCAVGWYTTTVPLSVGADVTDAGLAAAGVAVRRAVGLAEVPLDQVIGSLPAPLVQSRADVFMVSWIDYRKLPGAALARARDAHHVSASTLADDVQLWLSRTADGIAVRARIPETPTARETVSAVLDAWARLLGEAGRGEGIRSEVSRLSE